MKVSVVIPCFKQAAFLPDAIRSVLAQTRPADEIVVVAGDEESVAVAKAGDIRWVVVRDDAHGLSNARNVGIEASTGTHIVCLDADDKLHPEYLEKVCRRTEEDMGGFDIVSTWLKEFGARDGAWHPPPWSTYGILTRNLLTAASLFPKSLWKNVGGFDPAACLGYEDWNFWIGCSRFYPRVATIPEELFLYRMHEARDSDVIAAWQPAIHASLRALNRDLFPTQNNGPLRELPDEARRRMRARAAQFPENTALQNLLLLSGEPCVRVVTDHPLAKDSPDHTHPWGTARDNSKHPAFCRKLYSLFEGKRIRVLDLGCSGGGFVADCITDGHMAVGLEGSDYSRRHKRAEWPALDGVALFTADIAKTFSVRMLNDSATSFHVITAWEVLEHLTESGLEALSLNVHRHIEQGGFWIVSVAPTPDVQNGVALHQTVKPKEWWLGWFEVHGWRPREDLRKFFGQDFVRGPNDGESFNLVLQET